jgi:hypothetical protein
MIHDYEHIFNYCYFFFVTYFLGDDEMKAVLSYNQITALHEPFSFLRFFMAAKLTSQINSSISSVCLLSQSAFYLKNSTSSSAVNFRFGAGVKVSTAGPAGTSLGTSMVSLWLAGISTVCVTVMGKV